MRICTLLALFALLSGCKSNSTEEKTPPLDPLVEDTGFQMASPDQSLKPAWETGWEMDTIIAWTDLNGFNQAFFAHKETVKPEDPESGFIPVSRELEVRHYVRQDTGLQLLRKVFDFTRDCGFDNMAYFRKASLGAMDVDENGVGELSFAYMLGCTSDLSPQTLKLLVLENGEKYIIRGNTRFPPEVGMDDIGGDKEVDPSVLEATKAIQDHMDAAWEVHSVWP